MSIIAIVRNNKPIEYVMNTYRYTDDINLADDIPDDELEKIRIWHDVNLIRNRDRGITSVRDRE